MTSSRLNPIHAPRGRGQRRTSGEPVRLRRQSAQQPVNRCHGIIAGIAMMMASVTPLWAQTPAVAQHSAHSALALPPAAITHHQAIDLPQPDQFADPVWRVNAYGTPWQLEAKPNRRFLDSLPAAMKQDLQRAGDRFFAGQVAINGERLPQSWLRLSYTGGRWSGGWFANGQLYLVDDVATVRTMLSTAPARDSGAIVYRMDDLVLPQLLDRSPVVPPQQRSGAFIQHLQRVTRRNRGSSTLQQLPITIVSDTQFSAINGGNTQANVAARLNFVDGIYSQQLSVSMGLLHHEVLSNNGPLTATDPISLLNQFASYMRTGDGSALPFGGLAHLFTGRDLDTTTVGIAYISVLCSSSFGFGVDQEFNGNTISALIFAHEAGHNFGAPHDGEDACVNETFRGIMNPSINGSTEFSQCSIQEMSDDIAAASCLLDVPILIYESGFEAP